MPWKESRTVNERMHFVTRLKGGERMTDLCREFGISRKTGYKFLERFKAQGPAGLYDESRKPVHSPNETTPQVKAMFIAAKREKPHWGASKIREIVQLKNPKLELPSRYTVHSILLKEGLVISRKGKRRRGELLLEKFRSNSGKSSAPNDLWCADFKGQFRMGNSKYCYPLTVTDHFSRYLLGCEGLEDTKGSGAIGVFTTVFSEHGLPDAIRTDNGSPFASAGLFGLSQLSVWWMRLGIKLQRIQPGHPEQNGRHERMHLTLKQQTTRPAGANLLQQQQRFDEFLEEFNEERPHEALKMKRPGDLYRKSKRPFPKALPELLYPEHDIVATVYPNGSVRTNQGANLFISQAFANQPIGLQEQEDDRWKINFMDLELGTYDGRAGKFTALDSSAPPAENPKV